MLVQDGGVCTLCLKGMSIRGSIHAVLHDKTCTKLSDATWTLIYSVLPVMEPMVDATEILSSKSYLSVSCISFIK